MRPVFKFTSMSEIPDRRRQRMPSRLRVKLAQTRAETEILPSQ